MRPFLFLILTHHGLHHLVWYSAALHDGTDSADILYASLLGESAHRKASFCLHSDRHSTRGLNSLVYGLNPGIYLGSVYFETWPAHSAGEFQDISSKEAATAIAVDLTNHLTLYAYKRCRRNSVFSFSVISNITDT
jgi:hypothetical protein